MRFLRNYIFSNWGLKLVALTISFLLWATYTADPFAEVGFQVPLEFTNMPAHLEISGDVPNAVQVRVRGHSALLRRLTATDLSLRVDMAGARNGESLIRVAPGMINAPYGATVVRISPAQFHLTLVPRGTPSPPG